MRSDMMIDTKDNGSNPMSSCAQLRLRDTRVPLATPSDVCVEQALHAGGCKTWLQIGAALASAWAA